MVEERTESSFLFLIAACRTRSSAFGTPFFRLCVRGVFCWPAFSLVRPLPSTASATVSPLCSAASPVLGPVRLPLSVHRWIAVIDLPGASLVPSSEGEQGISRFSRMEFPHVLEVFDRAGSLTHSPFCASACCLPPQDNDVGTLDAPFSRLNTPPVCTPVNASPVLAGTGTDSGPPWLAGPSV